MNRAATLKFIMCPGASPNDLVTPVLGAENGIHQHLQVVARGGIAMEVNTPGVLQDVLSSFSLGAIMAR